MSIGKMNVEHLGLFCAGLNALPENIKNNDVNMCSPDNPICDTVGCHAGLVSLVDVPELKALYTHGTYDYMGWADALAKFLGFNHRYDLDEWAYDHQYLWTVDNLPATYKASGEFNLFLDCEVFGQKNPIFKHQVIIDKWNNVHRLCGS